MGHYPTEIKNPKTPDEKNEQRLAALFRRHKANLLSTTVAEVESVKNNADRVKEVKDKLEQLRRHRPSKDEALRSQELQRQLLLMLRNEPKAVLQKEKWNEDEISDWWSNARIVEQCTIPVSCVSETAKKAGDDICGRIAVLLDPSIISGRRRFPGRRCTACFYSRLQEASLFGFLWYMSLARGARPSTLP